MKTYILDRFLATTILLVILGGCAFFSDENSHYAIQLQNDHTKHELKVELAKTHDELRQGLMNRENLKEGRGMLFIYEEPRIPSFWMKNMLIPLDIIFIDKDLKIKHIVPDTPPCPQNEKCPTYSPNVAVQYVLEVPAGYAEKYQINKGDLLVLSDLID